MICSEFEQMKFFFLLTLICKTNILKYTKLHKQGHVQICQCYPKTNDPKI